MPSSLKYLLAFLLTFACFNAHATSLGDTIKKARQFQPGSFNSNTINTSVNFMDGVKAVRKDSVDKGIHLMAESLNSSNYHTNLLYLLDYGASELIYVVKQLDGTKLSSAEIAAGKIFIKEVFTDTSKNAVKILNPVFNSMPNSVFVLRLKLLTYSSCGDSHLLSTINELLKKQPGLLSANILKAQYYYDKGNYAESIKWCSKSIGILNEYTYAWQLRGKCYEELGQGDKAIADYDEVLRVFPSHTEASYDRSDVLLDSDKYREAIPGFRWALRANPTYGYPAYNLSRCYKALSIRDSALYYVEQHINRYPDDGDGYNLKGEILTDNADYFPSIDFYNSAIKLVPANADFLENRGDSYFNIDSVDLAITDYKKAISLNKNRAYTEDRMGDCYYKKKDYENALIHYKLAIYKDPTYKYAYADIDLIYNKQGKYKDGIELLKKALAIDSTYTLAIGNLGWEYYCIGNYDECIRYSNKALNYEPDASYAMFNIALATLCKGDFDKAKERYTYYYNLCKQKGYDMHVDGATNDLRSLINTNHYKEQAADIIKNVFSETP